MDRRENLRLLLSGSLATGFILTAGCNLPENAKEENVAITTYNYGRTPEEVLHDQKMENDVFFTERERKMVEILVDIIIPKDEKSGSATDAGVPDFIEFMMKDYPNFQLTMRGGLQWLESMSLKQYNQSFTDLNEQQRMGIIDEIAWPDKATQEMAYGVRFFNLMRNLTCTGFFTTEMGIKDLDYQGNTPNQWDGVPQEVLDKYGLSYDERTLEICLNVKDQHKIAQWDEEGNLI
ncbi:MAG: gluconate 2-dehydrogenase subunit 3 family protein [Chitinophagales bacterium]|nr:gluconate 2-dehydrogenase subunit 3 family protein [Chitinophagales bacterium]